MERCIYTYRERTGLGLMELSMSLGLTSLKDDIRNPLKSFVYNLISIAYQYDDANKGCWISLHSGNYSIHRSLVHFPTFIIVFPDLPSIQINFFQLLITFFHFIPIGVWSFSDDTRALSKSVFVTNFPDSTSSKDLWTLCQGYATVVDVYIPNRKSKAGKWFAFVRFIRVINLDRLINNLCTLWIGRMHLHANVVRFARPSKRTAYSIPTPANPGTSLFASVLKGNHMPPYTSPSPAIVMDDTCVVHRNLELHVMGEVKNYASIPNLYVLLDQEGFKNVKLVYLGGLWVMIELESLQAKESFMQHVGVASWFSHLRNSQMDFVSRDCIVLVDLEGVPLHVWTRATFIRIGSKWGEVLELEEGVMKVDYNTDVESTKGSGANQGDAYNKHNVDDESNDEAVSETCFGDN
nr:RNA-directed DNA polymerase, eukaryota, nucleotide-binding alpha-beta plait domain protein [Tanacetum cinerariifolium]